jgi:hypothetical protein
MTSTPPEVEGQLQPVQAGSGPGGSVVGVPGIVVLSVAILALSALAILLLVGFWPSTVKGQLGSSVVVHQVLGNTVHVTLDANLQIIALLAGGIGGLLHSLRSIAWYVGNRSLKWSWTLFYACLPFVGAIMALLFYFLLRGGLISAQGDGADISPFGVAAIAGLVGLFSNQGAEMLKNAFSAIFAKAPRGSDSTPSGG